MSNLNVNAFRGFLASSLQTAGSEATFYLDRMTTLNGETISTSDFSVFGRGIVTFDPLSATDIEFGSFTGVDATNVALTGGIRGLSAKGNTSSTGRMIYHPVGTPVIISFGVHNIEDLKSYMDGLVIGSLGSATNSTSGTTKITENLLTRPRSIAALVSQQTSPNMTYLVNPFCISVVDKNVNFVGGSTGTLTAPVSNPRIDLVVYDTVNSVIAVRGGSENASPVEPTPTSGDVVLASIYHRVGETVLKEESDGTNGYIKRWYFPVVYRTDIATSTTTANFPTNQFGSGVDGAVTISSPTSLTRDMYYTTLAVNSTLTTNGWRIYVNDTISGTGTIDWGTPNNGSNGSGSSGANGGAAASTGRFRNSAGGHGGNGADGGGNAGTGQTSSAATTLSIGVIGGSGGDGATSTGNTRSTGSAGGSILNEDSLKQLGYNCISGVGVSSAGTAAHYQTSTGGGGGGGGAQGNTNGGGGGGGGASGGTVWIVAKTWAGTFIIKAIGGNGGNGGGGTGTGGGGGGGGGGAGGTSVVVYKTKTWTGTYTLTGGTGGTVGSGGTPTAGATGTTGVSYEIDINTLAR